MLRTFIAVPLPEEALRGCSSKAHALERALGPLASRVRFARAEGIHLTLKFLGATPEDDTSSIVEALARAAASIRAFPMAFAGLAGFPSLSRPRVVFLEASAGAKSLVALAQRVEEEVAPLGFPTEQRRFTPHLTLARVKDPGFAPRIGALLARASVDAPDARCEAKSIALFASRLHPAGASYRSLAHVPLGG
jgi:2'-5' RNA ligase